MARPIKDTPVLTGKDAKHFEKAIKENERKPISESEVKRIMSARQKFEFLSFPRWSVGTII